MSLSVAGEKPAGYGDHWSAGVTSHSSHVSIPHTRSAGGITTFGTDQAERQRGPATPNFRLGSLPAVLLGREEEFAVIREFLQTTAVDGGTLLLSGEPGIGKTALLDAAVGEALAAGTKVVRTTGSEAEAGLRFSGLNQVLAPLHEGVQHLRAPHRTALSVVSGLSDEAGPNGLVVGTAALALLRWAAATHPVVVAVDDLHAMDRWSTRVLGFVARRLTGTGVGFIATTKSDAGGVFDRRGLIELEVQPLDDDAADRLLRSGYPAMVPAVRARLQVEARGNPLALVELPRGLNRAQHMAIQALPSVLPLSKRLQATFSARINELPAETRRLLLLTALETRGDLRTPHAQTGRVRDPALLAAAEDAELVRVDQGTGQVEFRHPLISSAVIESSTGDERRRTHRELATLLVGRPDRIAWHLAEAAVEPDEHVAGLMDQAAQRLFGRGDSVAGVTALLRAADLSPAGTDQARRLLQAAYVSATVTGNLSQARHLLAQARRAHPSGRSCPARAATVARLLNANGEIDTPHRHLVDALRNHRGPHDARDNSLTEALHTLVEVSFFGGPRPVYGEPIQSLIARLEPEPPALLSVCNQILADPARTTGSTLAQLDSLIDSLHDESNPTHVVRTSSAAILVDRLAGCREALWQVVYDGRRGGAVASAISALALLSSDDFLTGQWDAAEELAQEGLELCDAHGYQLLARPLLHTQALLAAGRGDDARTRTLTDDMTRWARPRHAGAVQAYADHARALASLGRSDFDDAYHRVVAINPPGEFPAYVPHALWVSMDLVTAAVHSGRRVEAAAHVAAMRGLKLSALSPRLALLVAGSAALVAPAGEAAEIFEKAVTSPGCERWPFDLGRVQLAYGEHLRRSRATTQSRQLFTQAFENFERLGARRWAARAAQELRATGHASALADDLAVSPLTSQEREIALLAASGLTNKQIGKQLFLSHRTVGAHLYRVFPKLGITTRAALRDALATPAPTHPDESSNSTVDPSQRLT